MAIGPPRTVLNYGSPILIMVLSWYYTHTKGKKQETYPSTNQCTYGILAHTLP